MTRERAKWMDQTSFWTSDTAAAPGKLRGPPMASREPGRMLAFAPVPRVHQGNVGLLRLPQLGEVAMPQSLRRYLLQAGISTAGLAMVSKFQGTQAQDVLENLKILCGYPPGGAADVVSRHIAERLNGIYAKSSLVDNRPGAAGRIAVDALKSSAANGQTMLLTPSSVITLDPHVYQKLSYDAFKDLQPVSVVCDFDHGLTVGPAVPEQVKTLADFVVWAKANPTKADCSNPGEGSLPHLLTMLLAKISATPLQAVPYRGGAPAMIDLLGGRVAAFIGPIGPSSLQHVAEGRLRVLATSGAARSPFLPSVPTFAEQSFQDIVVIEWYGLFMPAGVSPTIVTRASDAVTRAIQKEYVAALAKAGVTATSSTPDALAQRIKAEYDFWGSTVNATGFKPLE